MNQPFVPLWRGARRTRALAGGGFEFMLLGIASRTSDKNGSKTCTSPTGYRTLKKKTVKYYIILKLTSDIEPH